MINLRKEEKIAIIISVLLFFVFFFFYCQYIATGMRVVKANMFKGGFPQVNKDTDVVFAGDSLVEYCDFSRFYNDIEAANTGIAQLSSNELRNAYDSLIGNKKPKKLVILIGCNDLAIDNNSYDNVISNIEYIANKTVTLFNTKIYIQSLYPVNKSILSMHKYLKQNRNNDNIVNMNEKIKALCLDKGYKYIDVHSILKNENGELKDVYTVDGLHVNNKAYEEISKLIKTYIKE